ncbi:MATE efflux family protein [Tilletiaria anomala UBC 951]|uniref:MATE efflux family protein n=1 Tax=Tilletiaria anomala (strain ATCC 24038 / CBS 436.72 / UBC 951) TaxID=1037660 RepID=A0A066W1T8_TILAU|nr:MATE efflux family protein [Tilletiaria anomala UBC 951]KDN44750.1 MATE efflux family protein [Tilletiaria anomala UBC 951]
MSFTSRYSSSPASVQRDYGLLQAPSTSYRPFQGLEDDVSEVDAEEGEGDVDDADDVLEAGSRRISRSQRQGRGARQARQRYSSASLSQCSVAGNEESLSINGADELDDSNAADEDGISNISFASPNPAANAPGSRLRRHSPAQRVGSMQQQRKSSRSNLTQSTANGTTEDGSALAVDSDARSLANRARGILLGGEARPPPIDILQVEEQALGQDASDLISPGVRPLSSISISSGSPTPVSPRFGFTSSGSLTPALAPLCAAAAVGAPTGPGQPLLSPTCALWQAPLPAREDVAKCIEELSVDGAASELDLEAATEAGSQAYASGTAVTERTPLLAASSGPSSSTHHGGESIQPLPGITDAIPGTTAAPTAASRTREVKVLVGYSLPVWGTHLLELSLNIVTVFSLGHLGTKELAAASLASMTANVTGFSILSGFVSALDSLLPAAYASASPWTVGLWTQRMTIITASLLIPISAVWWAAEPLLLALGQDAQVAALAAKYLFILSFALPAYAGFETSRRYLQAQGLFTAPTIAVSIASVINVPLNILLVYGPPSVCLGFVGAPIASLISYYLMLVLGLLQCYIAPRQAWGGWSWRALDFKGLAVCWQLGFASTTAMAAEWWAWEITGLLTSWLGTTPLAAQSVLLVTSSITYQLPYAIAVAGAVRVGNLLGANKPAYARLSSSTSLFIGLASGVANSAALVSLRGSWGWLFSGDKEVVDLVADILPFVAAFQIFDSICGVGGGILRGSGRQHLGAYINLVSYYLAGIPVSILLLKLDWRLEGIWFGLTVGLVLGSIGTTWVIMRTDWHAEARKVQERMEADTAPQVHAIVEGIPA